VTTNPAVYIKTGRGRGRPKKTEEIAKTNSRINEFFHPRKRVRIPNERHELQKQPYDRLTGETDSGNSL
jgi:hypothetical protein